jgi:hypothetical protein
MAFAVHRTGAGQHDAALAAARVPSAADAVATAAFMATILNGSYLI